MKYFSQDNWFSWSYGNGERFGRSLSPSDEFKVYHNPNPKPIQSMLAEGIRSAKSIADHFPGRKFDLFFSGGVDSEIMVRSFIEAGLAPRVHVVRYEDDINIYDVSYAYAVASSLGLKINIIDMNLKKFYETEAEKCSDEAQLDRPRLLPSLKYPDLVDGVSIIGSGDACWQRTDNDYSKKGHWKYWEIECDYSANKYCTLHNRESVHLWWRWTPELLLAHTKYKWFTKLINDHYHGKIGNFSTKLLGFKEEFPMLLERKKSTGFEKIESLILEFENFLEKKNNGLIYRQQIEYDVDDYFIRLTGKKFKPVSLNGEEQQCLDKQTKNMKKKHKK